MRDVTISKGEVAGEERRRGGCCRGSPFLSNPSPTHPTVKIPPKTENNGISQCCAVDGYFCLYFSALRRREKMVCFFFVPGARHITNFFASFFVSSLTFLPFTPSHLALASCPTHIAPQRHSNITHHRMLIAHVIGGVILFASFLLRMPQTSSTLSLFLTAFKSMAPVSLIQQIEDVFSISPPTPVDSPSFYPDVVFSPSPAVTDLVVYYPPFQFSNLGSVASANRSAELVVRAAGQVECLPSLDRDEEKPVSNNAAYFNIFLLLAPPCAILTLYLTYVSHP